MSNFKLPAAVLAQIQNKIQNLEPEKKVAASSGSNIAYSCNGCSGTCNMTCKGGCGSNYGN